jgi:hypothetical protein
MRTALLILIGFVMVLTGCSVDQERQEIIDFINDSNNSAVFDRAANLEDDWNTLMSSDFQTYTRSQLIYEIGLLEQRAGQSYKDLGEVVTPKCLRGFMDKEIEASRLLFQAMSLAYRAKDDPNITQDQINELIFRADDLKTEAMREFEGICEQHNVKMPW